MTRFSEPIVDGKRIYSHPFAAIEVVRATIMLMPVASKKRTIHEDLQTPEADTRLETLRFGTK
jgi:hypothetical protein